MAYIMILLVLLFFTMLIFGIINTVKKKKSFIWFYIGSFASLVLFMVCAYISVINPVKENVAAYEQAKEDVKADLNEEIEKTQEMQDELNNTNESTGEAVTFSYYTVIETDGDNYVSESDEGETFTFTQSDLTDEDDVILKWDIIEVGRDENDNITSIYNVDRDDERAQEESYNAIYGDEQYIDMNEEYDY
ncbi:hypothetical protein [Priestia aryabhattai]|uniref:hypothetical protein n=1 Tax=Priestia aryabhattai TaxID=412384 RepID=UPI0015F52F69|nr:hypothetical protein [Priestia aryabhattai]